MLDRRWQGLAMLLLICLLCNASGSFVGANMIPSPENSPSEFAKIVQSKQTKQARVFSGGADHRSLRSLANTGEEVILTVPNDQLEHIAEFPEEAELWVAANVVRFLPATRITHVVAGDDVLVRSPGSAYFLVPAMINLHSALAAARLDGRVKVSSAVSGEALAAPPAWAAAVAEGVLRFLNATGAPLFLESRPSEATDTKVDAAYAAMRALGFPGAIPVIAAPIGTEELPAAAAAVVYHSYLLMMPHGGGGVPRRALATAGTFCVALQNADPAALQAGLSWACGPGQADCSAIQPGGPCFKQNNLPALASYAYNDYYQKMASTGATCSFNGTATTTTADPSSGSCVFAGSSMAGGSNTSVPGASPPTTVAPPAGFTPPAGTSPPTDFSPPSAGTTPPTGFSPPAGGGFGPPGSFNGSGSFGPSSTFSPYAGGHRDGVSRARLGAIVLAVLLLSIDLM
ncbi:glucan endo-1,3-beta-glucosidase 4-like [Oryza brachyantha]|uniref:glucan endo-1,3-beta-glucosidase 4-like n=1 Tax=Oryza brachyantha TaxID=4533 RepID=UPI001ADCDC42|nr:glucan endo-1,3-beta-glucosidase 4-like [Oryza brachyantha]XP_040378202.1 glucan endo-1,3-beta-glucosidase 4-like [Oryza brachyantha]